MGKQPDVKAAPKAGTDLSSRIAAGAKAVQGTTVVPDLTGDRKELERQNIAVLQSPDAQPFDKDVACRRLAIVGTKEAVPALAALAIADEKLCDVACWGLERIPDPAADEALRAALNKVKGRQQQKVIQTLANRRDAKAVGDLARLLPDSDVQVAGAAARALGKIGGPEASKALTDALDKAPEAVRSAVGDGCVTLGDMLLAAGKGDEAAAVFDRTRKAKLPKHILAAATRGAILARKADGVPLLIEQLKSGDKAMVTIALRAVRELPHDAARALEAQQSAAPEDLRVRLAQALKDRPKQ